MQVETRGGPPGLHRVPRKVGLVLVGVTLLLLLASGPAQASTAPQLVHPAALANVMTRHVGTYAPTYTLWCGNYHVKSYLTAYGYVRVGYTEIDVGVCYDNNYRATIQWGPSCPSQWFVPFIRMSSLNSCGWWRDANGYITVYGNWTGQLWIPLVGWCCDRIFTEQYGV